LGEANSLLLVNEATTQRTRDTQLAILLAIQSLRVQPSQRADIALQESLNELHIINRLPNSSEIAPALSPDGAWIAVQNTPTQIGIFDTLTQEQRHSLNVPDVRLLAWSNDGLHLLTVNSERLVQLWEVSTQQETARLTFDTLPTAVTLSADNRVVLATDNDTHEYWDMTNATRLTLLDGLEPMQPAFSPDGKWALATDSATDVYYTVDLGSGERVERNFGAQQGVYNMQQNKLYVLQADGQEIRLFNTQTWEYLPEPVSFSLEFSLPNALMAISQDDRFIAMSEEGGIIRLIDRLTGRSPRSFVAHTANITAIRFANSDAYEYREPTRETIPGTDGSGRTMLTQDATGMMILWDFNRDQQIRTYYGFTQPIANYLPNSDYIALTSGTESFVLDARLGIKPNAASYAQGQVTTVALTAWLNENQAVAFSPLNGTVFNPNTFNPVFTFYNRRQANSEAEFALSGNQQATPNAPQGSNPPQGQPPQGGNPPQGQPPQGGQPNQQTGNPSSSNSAVYSGFVSADGATIWYSDSREIKQYNVATQTTTTLPLRHAKALVALAVSADAEKIYALDADGNLVAWDTATRQPPTTQALLENTSAEDRSVFRLLLSTDNHYLLAYQRGISHSVVVFHVQEQTQTAIMCDTPIYDVSLVQNVAWVLCGQGLLRHTLINPNTTLVLEGFSDTYQAVAVAENGEWLALGSHTGNIDIYAQRELPLFIRQVVNVHQGSVTTIRFVRGDTRLISGGSDGFVAINAVTLDDLIDVACERITRDLTTVERTNFEVQNDQRTCG
jgi:WD40 repeat protein